MRKRSSNGAVRRTCRAFTLLELLISVGVVGLLVLLVAQLMSSATAITRTGNKHIDTDTEARAVLDRMALDFAQILKRTDVDYYIKAPIGYKNPKSHGQGKKLVTGQLGNDQIAFFSHVPGYYPSGSQSPISLVAYRLNSTSQQLERMGKGLLWNGVSNPNQPPTNSSYTSPMVFLDSATPPLMTIDNRWPAATDSSAADADYELIGPQVFRFEYYYLLKDGTVTDVPKADAATTWDLTKTTSANLNAFSDVEAIAVVIAVIDPASRSLVFPTGALFNLASDMSDFKTAKGKGLGNLTKYIGVVEADWKSAVESAAATGLTSDGSPFPPVAASAVRIYSRYFDVRTLPGF